MNIIISLSISAILLSIIYFYEKRGHNISFVITGISIFFCLLITIGFFFLISREYTILENGEEINMGVTGQVGDFVGGVVGTLVAGISIILLYNTLSAQRESSKKQTNQFLKQAEDVLIERFENRFFEMIRLHRANLEELNIQDIVRGRKVFTTFYFELRYIYFALNQHYSQQNEVKLSLKELTNIAYLIFFFGIGHTTDNIFKDIAPEIVKQEFFKKTISFLKTKKSRFRPNKINPDLILKHAGSEAIFKQIYEPFTGHGTKIGHYYRHLFQAVKYVAKQENPILTKEIKYSYVKMLRAQLSNIEQVLFYYNAVSSLGYSWIEKGYLKEYKMIINLPLSFADFGIEPEEMFKKEIDEDDGFFDWKNLKRMT